MPLEDPRVDAYIARSAAFAQPILQYLRALVHEVCPDVVERIKWGFPHFDYRDRVMCSMAAFKQHCGFGFWLFKEVVGGNAEEGMGQFGKITSMDDLPPKRVLTAYIRKAMALNQAGITAKRPKAVAKPLPDMPADVAALLKKNTAAQRTYDAFTPSMQREYLMWIGDAKTDATRQKRIATTLEWLAEGKQRNWKYAK